MIPFLPNSELFPLADTSLDWFFFSSFLEVVLQTALPKSSHRISLDVLYHTLGSDVRFGTSKLSRVCMDFERVPSRSPYPRSLIPWEKARNHTCSRCVRADMCAASLGPLKNKTRTKKGTLKASRKGPTERKCGVIIIKTTHMSPFGTSPMTQMTDFSCLISEIFELRRPLSLLRCCSPRKTLPTGSFCTAKAPATRQQRLRGAGNESPKTFTGRRRKVAQGSRKLHSQPWHGSRGIRRRW